MAFLAANLFIASFYIDIWCTPNPVSRALPVLTLLDDGSLIIDKYARRTGDRSIVNEHYYSDKAPFPTIAAVPFYWLVRTLGMDKTSLRTGKQYPIHIWRPINVRDGRLSQYQDMIPLLFMCSFLFGSIPFTIMVFLTLKKALHIAGKPFTIVLVMMSFYGSFIFVFAGTFFNHVFAAMLLLLGYIFITDRIYFRSGLCVGMSFLSEYTIAVAIPLWMLIIFLREKNLKMSVLFGLGVLPSIVFFMIYNLTTTGHPLTTLNAYHAAQAFSNLQNHYGFAFLSLQAIGGLSFGIYSGLLPHAPILLLGGYFLFKECLSDALYKKLFLNYLFAFSVVFFLLISSFFTWWGGWTYGPRYLLVLAALLIYENTIYLTGKNINRLAFWVLGAFGLASTWLAKITVMYMVPDKSNFFAPSSGTIEGKLYILQEFFNSHFNGNNILSLGWGVKPVYAAYLWLGAFVAVTTCFTFWYKKIISKPNSAETLPDLSPLEQP